MLRRFTGDGAGAQDLVQETLAKAARSHGPREPGKERAWLAAIAMNAARDNARKVLRRHEVPAADGMLETAVSAEEPSPEEVLLDAEMATCIAELLDRLPGPQREVVALHDLIGLNHREIAERLGISEANSRVTLHRGRLGLREIFSEGCELNFAADAVPCERKHKG
jgi:RNA polymerase sigma-70 factor (ECF subfamily)